jgi:CheY-like chemotaxis protein/DnaJ-domain-containing protein 1
MGGTVLCVDNDRNLCEILAKALRSEGYRVATAHDGDAALDAIGRCKPDLMLLDLILPKRDGFAVLEAVRRMPAPLGALPVVLISGCSPTPEYTQRAEALRAAALLRKPVSLENLLAAVARGLGQAPRKATPRSAAAREEAARAAEGEAGLAGSFQQLPFAALLHHLHGLRATGVLHLSHERKRKWLRLRDGYPIAVRSNLVNECLGNHLVRAGRITASELAESRRRMKGGELQGEILVAMDLLSEDEIAVALRAQAEEKLFEIFTWPNGEFRFETGGNLQRANDLSLERSPANVILEGVRTRLPLERIDAYLASHSHCMVGVAESPFYRFQEVDLDTAQLKLVHKLEKPRRLAEFIGADENIRRTVYALIAAGTLELQGETAGKSEVAGKAAPKAAARSAKPAKPSERPQKATLLREVVRPSTAAAEEAKSAELAALAQRFRGQTPFQILDVPETADEEQIQAAYGKLCERTHPDRVSHANDAVKMLASEVFAMVANAYETLIDPRRRQGYLLGLKKASREAAEREVGKRALEAQMQFQQGDAALRARDYGAALRCFGRALELYPDEGEYHAHYGWTLHLSHPSDPAMASEAMEHVQRALKLAPDQEKPYLFMGRLCKAIGRADVAEKMFARALKIQPECLDALRELRLINMRREKGKGLIGRLLRR